MNVKFLESSESTCFLTLEDRFFLDDRSSFPGNLVGEAAGKDDTETVFFSLGFDFFEEVLDLSKDEEECDFLSLRSRSFLDFRLLLEEEDDFEDDFFFPFLLCPLVAEVDLDFFFFEDFFLSSIAWAVLLLQSEKRERVDVLIIS